MNAEITLLHRPVPLASVQGTLALDLRPLLDLPEVPPPGTHGNDVVEVNLPDRRAVEVWARRYVQAAVEIVVGDRPVSQVLRVSTARVYADLSRRALLVAHAGGHIAGLGAGRQTTRPQLRSLRLSFVRDDAVETSAHIRYGDRSRAVAARFELVKGAWKCVALDFS